MSVYKDAKTGKWFVKIRYKDWTGKNIDTTKRGFETRREAVAYETNFMSRKAGTLDMKFSEFIELYMEERFPRLKEVTRETKLYLIKDKILPYFGERKLNEITSTDIIKWQNEMLSYRDAKGKPYSKSYLKELHTQINAIFNYAVRYYKLPANPASIAGNFGSDNEIEMDFWTTEEYLKFADQMMDEPPYYYFFQILYWLGVREGEALALTKEDFNFEKKTVTINKTFQILRSGKRIITSPKTVKSNRTISVPDFLCEELKAKIESVEASKLSEMSAQREAHKAALQAKEAEIAHYKDFRSRQSIKHLGESLEDHCRIEYESIRTLLPNATFEKDNKVSETGSKGDFIFRENDTTGAFLLSVMFEMKTEEETSTHKHKNEDFLKELDKDRREKDCEYAVLVTTLEPDNDLYNRGIVDVSHKYPKMLIIRPQFFLVLLMILRSVALDKTSLRKKIYDLESQQMSATSLEQDLLGFKDSVVKCLDLATSNREKAIKRLDSAIKLLEDTKDDLLKMEKHSDVAKKKAENVTIQKLKKEYPSIIAASDADIPKSETTTAETIPETSSPATDPVAQNNREELGKSA